MIRTLGRMLLLSAMTVVMLHGRAGAEEESSLGRILEFQKKLHERIDYELLVQTSLDKALDHLLTRQGIPWTVNQAALVAAQQDNDVVRKTEVDKIDKMVGVTRAAVLKKLLDRIPTESGNGAPTYVLRRDHIEITTLAARAREAEGMRATLEDTGAPDLPPLAYAGLQETPLQDALKELARTTESNVVLDVRCAAEGKTKVTAELAGVPLDTAIQLLADMANLKLVRVANVYYVTSPKNARLLHKEEEKRRLEVGQRRQPTARRPVFDGPSSTLLV